MLFFFIHFWTTDNEPQESVDLADTPIDIEWLAAFPTIIVAYGFNPAFFPAFSSLKSKTVKNGMITGMTSVTVASLIYMISPLAALELYGTDIQANLLLNVAEEDDIFPTILQFIFIIICVVQITIIFYLGKEALLIIFDEVTRKSYSQPENLPKNIEIAREQKVEASTVHPINDQLYSNDGNNDKKEGGDIDPSNLPKSENENQSNIYERSEKCMNTVREFVENSKQTEEPQQSETKPEVKYDPKEYLNMKQFYYYSITLFMYFVIVLLSITVSDVEFFFGIIGANTGVFVTYIGPGSFYLICFHKTKGVINEAFSRLIYILAWIYTIGGVILLIGFNIIVILNTFG